MFASFYLMIGPSEFKKFWQIEKYWNDDKGNLIAVDIFQSDVRICPITQLAQITDTDVTFKA